MSTKASESRGSVISATPSQRRALWLAIMLLLALAGGAAGLVQRGLATGETYSPGKRATSSRLIRRDTDPAMFWFVLSLYGAAGAGALTLAVRGLFVPVRPSPTR